ncbi:MAG TPA: hypothetical protein VGK02_06030 [Candidatus Aquicultor sp.]|jgi:hypothetical protein
MREIDIGRVHIKSIISKHLLDAGFDPYQGDMERIVDAVSRAVQDILKEYTRSMEVVYRLPSRPGEGRETA